MRRCCRGRGSPASWERHASPQPYVSPFIENESKVTGEVVPTFMKRLASMNKAEHPLLALSA